MHAMNPAFVSREVEGFRERLTDHSQIQDCLSLFETLQDSMRQAKPVNQTTPIMEKLALRALAKPIQDHDSNNSHHDDDRQDDDEREASMEAKEDQAALRSLGQPMTWDLCHVSLSYCLTPDCMLRLQCATGRAAGDLCNGYRGFDADYEWAERFAESCDQYTGGNGAFRV
jgi:hypothetical protein